MNAEAIVSVSAAVVALVQLAKWGFVPDRFGPLAVLTLSLLGVAFWGWSQGDFTRASAFGYFAGWIAVATSAAGVFGFSRASSDTLTRMRGTGNGTPLPSVMACLLTGSLLLGAVSVSGCATAPPVRTQNTIAQANLTTAQALSSLQSDEIALHEAGGIPDADHRVWQRSFRALADAGEAINAWLRNGAWNGSAVQLAIVTIDQVSRDLMPRVPADRRPAMQLALESARAALVVAAAQGGQ